MNILEVLGYLNSLFWFGSELNSPNQEIVLEKWINSKITSGKSILK